MNSKILEQMSKKTQNLLKQLQRNHKKYYNVIDLVRNSNNIYIKKIKNVQGKNRQELLTVVVIRCKSHLNECLRITKQLWIKLKVAPNNKN